MKIWSIFLVMVLTACSSVEQSENVSQQKIRSEKASRSEKSNVKKAKEVTKSESIYPQWMTEIHQNAVVACAKVKRGNIAQAQSVALAKAQANIAFARSSNVTSSIDVQEQVVVTDSKESVNSVITQNTHQNTSGNVVGYEIKKSELVKLDTNEKLFCILYGVVSQ